MSNKYLEKIAVLGGAVRSLGRIAKKTVRAVGNQFHLSDGGGFRDLAQNHFNIKDANKLADIDGSKEGIKALKRHAVKSMSGHSKPSAKTTKDILRKVKKELPDLHNGQTDARILAGGIVGTGAYGAYKVKKKLDEPNVETYNY